MSRLNQQELTFIAEFLNGFEKSAPRADGKIAVNLERLGQYLRHENLQTCLTPEGSEWSTMLEENDCLHNYAHIVKQDFNSSLLQSHTKLIAAVENIFTEAYQGLVDHFVMTSISLSSFTSLISSHIASNGNLLLAVSEIDSKILKLFNIEYSSTESVTLNSKVTTIDVNKQGWWHCHV